MEPRGLVGPPRNGAAELDRGHILCVHAYRDGSMVERTGLQGDGLRRCRSGDTGQEHDQQGWSPHVGLLHVRN